MSVLVTGTAGFIGFHLSLRLLEARIPVIGFDNLNSYYDVQLKLDRLALLREKSLLYGTPFHFTKGSVENTSVVEEVFSTFSPKRVVHLAAQAGVRHSIENPSVYVQANLVGFGNILEGCRHSGVKNLVYASSSSVFGGNKKLPFTELSSVDHPISLYAATKKANEMMAHSYSHLYGIPTTGLRFFTAYGPWGRPDMALFIFTKAILEGKPIQVFNDGNMIRDFTYIDDIVESIIRLLDKPAMPDLDFDHMSPSPSSSWAPYRIFNVGNSNSVPLMDYIHAIEDAVGAKSVKEFLPMQDGDVIATEADTSQLEAWIGFKPSTSIKEGVAKFVHWYREYYSV